MKGRYADALAVRSPLGNWQRADGVGTGAGVLPRRIVPQTSEACQYDADGNLLSDGRWLYSWDAENRLVMVVARTGAGPQQSMRFDYDAQGRRIRKRVWDNTTFSGPPSLDHRFVYDGWNLIAVLDAQSSVPLQSFVWGLDLSGTLQGAGGVGGLLQVTHYGTQTTNCFVAFDGNGNVMALVSASDGSESARYEYGPFAELTRATGPLAAANPFRFSTKYQDAETDLLYYGYRYYSPTLGRWLSRDLLAEKGGRNLLVFGNNDSANTVDPFGLALWQRLNCKAISLVGGGSVYEWVGVTIRAVLRGEICDCRDCASTAPLRKRDYVNVSASLQVSAGVGFGASVELPVLGEVGWTIKGPQWSSPLGLAIGKDCGQLTPPAVTAAIGTSWDLGGSFEVGRGFGGRVEWWGKLYFGAYARLSTSSFAAGFKHGGFGGGQATIIIPWPVDEINFPFWLFDYRVEEEVINWPF